VTKTAKGLCFIKNLKDMQRVERLVWGGGGGWVFFLFIVNAIGQSFDGIDRS